MEIVEAFCLKTQKKKKRSSVVIYDSNKLWFYIIVFNYRGKFTASHTLTICSPVDDKQQIQATQNQSQSAVTVPKARPSQSVLSPPFSDNQEDFQQEPEGTEQQIDSSFCGSKTFSLQVRFSSYITLYADDSLLYITKKPVQLEGESWA